MTADQAWMKKLIEQARAERNACAKGSRGRDGSRSSAHANGAASSSTTTGDEEISAAILLDQVYEFLGRFIVYPSKHAQVAHTLWVAHTHIMDAWESTPRLAFLSPEPSSGKTRALEVSVLLVPNPVEAINVTPAYLFRKVGSEDGPPTILYDEIDTVFGPKAKDNEEIRALLNAGHRKGAVAGRCVVRGKIVETEEIPAYCAVALAGLGWLPETIMTRSIIIQMRRRAPGERIQPFRRRLQFKQATALRDRLAAWGKSAAGHLADNWPELPDGITDRDADVWEPIVAIADLARGDWPKRARETAVEMTKTGKDRELSLGIRLLADLRTIFADDEVLASKVIVDRLIAMDEAPWGDLKGKPINQRGLASRLRQYVIKPDDHRFDDGRVLKGYRRIDLYDAWRRYLSPSPDKSATSATSATDRENLRKSAPFCSGYGENRSATAATSSATGMGSAADEVAHVAGDVADSVPAKPLKMNGVADVADVAGNGGEGSVCAHCGSSAEPGNPIEYVAWPEGGFRLHRGCVDRADPKHLENCILDKRRRKGG